VCLSFLVASHCVHAGDDGASLSDGKADCDVDSAEGSTGNMLLMRKTPEVMKHIELDDAAMDSVNEEGSEQIERQVRNVKQFVMESRLASIREKHTAMMEMLTRQAPELSFELPFDASGYMGAISASAQDTQAVAYYKIDDDKIYFGLAGQGDFVGVGLNRKGPTLAKADVVQCGVDPSGSVTVKDSYVNQVRTGPEADTNQDWEVLSSGASGGVTWCEIARARTTCETVDFQAPPSRTDTLVNGLLAWKEPNVGDEQAAYAKAEMRPVSSFAFSGSPADSKVEDVPADTASFTITAPDHQIPSAVGGSFACSYHVLPIDKQEQYHVVKFRMKYDPTSPARINGMAHHVNLNACERPLQYGDGQAVNCDAVMSQCNLIWMSSPLQYVDPGYILPSDTGLLMGKDGPTYVVILRHIYNPDGLSGIVDSGTNFQIWFTPDLRPLTQSSFIISTRDLDIPPNNPKSVSSAMCPGGCTSRFGGSAHVRNIAFHLHAHGTGAVLRVFRDGAELDPFGTMFPFDNRMAEWAIDRTIEPGDDLKLECTFKNDGDTRVVYGASTNDEMCVATLEVASSGDLHTCFDFPLGLQVQGTSPPPICYKPDGTLQPWKACDWTAPRTYCPKKSGGKTTEMYDMPTIAPYEPPVSCGSSAA